MRRPSGKRTDAGFHTTGTHDLLVLRDIIEALVQASWNETGWLADPDVVRERLRQSRWNAGRIQGAGSDGLPLFDEEGNRTPHTGEHVDLAAARGRTGPQFPESVPVGLAHRPADFRHRNLAARWRTGLGPSFMSHSIVIPQGTVHLNQIIAMPEIPRKIKRDPVIP